jgi:non-ribosomal peptide synthetase component E (peptide arylation enzyme)
MGLRQDWGGRLVPHPPEAVARYREAGHWGTRTIAAELREVAERHPDRLAVVAPDGVLTYAELDRQADRVAAGLYGLGLMPGERVILQIGNSAATALAWYGTLKAGLIPVCTLMQHRRHEISEIARQAEAVAHVVQADHERTDLVAFARRIAADSTTMRELITIGAAAEEPATHRLEDLGADSDPATARSVVNVIQGMTDADEVAVFQLSGGTTSVPKIIPRMHAEYWYNARGYADFWGWDGSERVAHLLPLIHNAGIVCGLHAPHSVGACALIGVPDPAIAAPLLADNGVTDMMMNLTLADLAFANPALRESLTTVKRLVFTGSPLPEPVAEAYETDGRAVVQLFGMGEGLFTMTPATASQAVRHHTVGVPLSPDDEARICDPESGAPLPLGTPGELQARGPYTLRGYFDAADRNAEAFTADGFYRTGDVAVEREIDGARCYAIEGRLKDVISRGGEKVNVEEVELLMLEHPRIRLAAVVAMPDPRLGERACAYAVLEDAADAMDLAELVAFFDAREVAKFKWPERLEVVDDLPRTNIGKIDKKALREDIAGKLETKSVA